MSFSTKIKGFTLIELIIVIAIIGILASIVVVAINPAQQFQRARDTQRKSDVTSILSAIGQYQAETDGYLTSIAGVGTASQTFDICVDPTNPCSFTATLLNSSVSLFSSGQINYDTVGTSGNRISPTYISTIPVDPNQKGAALTCTVNHSDLGISGTVIFPASSNSSGYLLTVEAKSTGGAFGPPYILHVWSPCAELNPASATR